MARFDYAAGPGRPSAVANWLPPWWSVIQASTLTNFGSVDSRMVERDLTRGQRRDFTVRKEVLGQSATATDAEAAAKEVEYILALRANDLRRL